MDKDRAVQISYFLLRVVSGLLFMQHGGQKIFDWFGGIPVEHGGRPPLLSMAGIGGVLEFFGGLAVMLGLGTRIAAFVVSGQMAVAYWLYHFKPNVFWPLQNGGEPAVLYCFIFLFIAAMGGGPYSLDALIRKKRV